MTAQKPTDSKKIRIAINGFGRIGRASYKILVEKPNVEIVAINDLGNARVLAHLLKYDSAYGIYDKKIEVEEDGKIADTEGKTQMEDHFSDEGDTPKESYLVVEGKKSQMFAQKDPLNLPWKDLDIDVVLECTGHFVKDGAAQVHIDAGAKKVVVSAPAKGEGGIQSFLKGVNHDSYLGQNVISNASCTTNCVSPVTSIIHKNFKIVKAALTTIHSVTAAQSVVDGAPHYGEDLRRSRSALNNIIPTTTGAAKATATVIPDIKDRFDGIAVRVPTLVGSLSDITFLIEKKTSVEEVNDTFVKASKESFYKDVLDVSYEPLVSSDIIKSPYSSIVDLTMTKVIDGDFVKVLAWYDNEWGYSNRLVDMALMVAE